MRSITLTVCMLLIAATNFAQTDNRKTIEVTGRAEMEIVPDEIYLNITLKEYKKLGKIISINSLEEGLVKAVNQVGIPKENLMAENIYGNNWNWRRNKTDDFLATKSFKLKLTNVKSINSLIEKLDEEGVSNMNIGEVSHTKIEEYKRQLKIEAIKQAKLKAKDLLAAIDEEIGGAISVNEIDNRYQPMMYATSNMVMERKMESDYQSDVEFKNITIQAEIHAIFEIK